MTVFAKLDRPPAYRRVSELVEEMITSGQLAPGDELPTEAELSEQLGVNRSTVREGLRGIEHSGLVKRDGKRLKVVLPHYSELASRTSRALVMHRVTFRELWEASVAIETFTAVLATQRIGSTSLRALEANIEEMAEHLDDINRFVSLDIEFHDIIAGAAGNRALSLAREPISLLFYPAGKLILSELNTQPRVLEAHKKIFALLSAHDEDGVRAWMSRHIDDIKRGYERSGLRMDSPVDGPLAGDVAPTRGALPTPWTEDAT